MRKLKNVLISIGFPDNYFLILGDANKIAQMALLKLLVFEKYFQLEKVSK